MPGGCICQPCQATLLAHIRGPRGSRPAGGRRLIQGCRGGGESWVGRQGPASPSPPLPAPAGVSPGEGRGGEEPPSLAGSPCAREVASARLRLPPRLPALSAPRRTCLAAPGGSGRRIRVGPRAHRKRRHAPRRRRRRGLGQTGSGSGSPERKRRRRRKMEQQQLRGLRDFLLAYNQMTELCFQRCVSNLNYRTLTGEEESCLDGCAGKLVRSNHRLMAAYVRLMPSLVQRRISDYEAAGQEAAQEAALLPPTEPATLPGPSVVSTS
ncbi:mitochondrial import inner membrane translocase subunit Tim10 B [Zootoca vivipara]|uniref:mitochondrial import inner membrane translocase subunit Tim10 B n=1 Tax=Zootoca vivipara TaxID=8524 RepID=UPI00293B9EA0|nr:mitochondrial import inner membrane translocase subunit Tim10 B [Zootoca vivipara]